MALRRCAAVAAAGLFAVICVDARAQPADNGAALSAPSIVDVQGGQVRVVTVATGLVHPWSLAFLPDGQTLFVAERAGRLRIIRNDVLDPEPVWTAPAEARAPAPDAPAPADDRLKWIALHPRFAENRLVYFSHPVSGERGTTLAVARGRFNGTSLVDVADIFVADAWETGGNMAGKILFGPDATLYVTVGDRDRLCCNGTDDNSLRLKAQDLGNHVGKTLRIRDDGSVPPDNPFVGRAGAAPEIFTYGHRNGYGLAFHPETGALWQAEIGPMGGDEVNILVPGHNYGWPIVSMGRNYTGTLVSEQPFHRDGMDDPRMFWVPSISPSSLAFYTGDKFPEWRNNMLVGALNGLSLQRVAFNQPSQAERREPLLRSLNLRIRDVQQSPDGYIYVATELSSGGSEANGTVQRLEPIESPSSP
ncbi:MAG TPA: PQQ-dependent sugar dehydrogenase [Gammaproteobacteria bacterium]